MACVPCGVCVACVLCGVCVWCGVWRVCGVWPVSGQHGMAGDRDFSPQALQTAHCVRPATVKLRWRTQKGHG